MAGMHPPRPDHWLHAAVEVRPSPIAGRGLFARAPIAAGTVVARLGGRLVDDAGLRAAFADADGYVDTIVVDAGRHLLLAPGGDIRFANHACDPNLGWADEYTLVATSGIAGGDELTSDYSTSTVDADWVLRCHCPSTRCRQMVTGEDWRIPQLQQRYAGWWPPYLQRLIDGSA
jgi:hypothetical protein